MAKFNDRTGEARLMNNGLKATISTYRNADDIDIIFENGQCVTRTYYHHFKNGRISCPMIVEKMSDHYKVTNVNLRLPLQFLIDECDLRLLSNGFATQNNVGYVRLRKNGSLVYLHREITGAKHDECVDHINGNTLDNRRSNLRICTHAENLRNRGATSNNTSGYKGVSFHRRYHKWESKINYDGKTVHLGKFNNASEAAVAYDHAAIKHHGEFAYTNFPMSDYI